MRKYRDQPPAADRQNAHFSLSPRTLEREAERLFRAYLEAFRNAPEADFLLKRYFFSIYFEKNYLQDNTFFIPRAQFLWFFTYYQEDDPRERTIALKKRSTSKADTTVECVTIQFREQYTPQDGVVEVLYERSDADEAKEAYVLKNTTDAIACAEKLLADFLDDQVTSHPY